MVKWLMAIVASVTLASGCAAADGEMVITPPVSAAFVTYKTWLTPQGFGFFAVTEDGQGASGWGCPDGRCHNATDAKTKAIASCEKANPGRHCKIFAANLEPVVDYKVGP